MSMIHDITGSVPTNKRTQRRGRGESSGRGKTCGRGNKGAGARSGGPHWKSGHEGGQTPIHRRMPKRGFSNDNFERRFHVVNLLDLNKFEDGTTVDGDALKEAGLVKDTKLPVKILGEGELTKKLTVLAGKYSKSAFDKIIALGGVANNAKGETFAFPKVKKKFIPREKVTKKKLAEEAAPAPTPAPAQE